MIDVFGTNVFLSTIVGWIIFGLIVGIIAHLIDPKNVRGGIVGTVLTGVIGALLGGFLANLIFGVGVTGFNLTSFIIAVALILAFLERMLLRNGHIRTRVTRLR